MCGGSAKRGMTPDTVNGDRTRWAASSTPSVTAMARDRAVAADDGLSIATPCDVPPLTTTRCPAGDGALPVADARALADRAARRARARAPRRSPGRRTRGPCRCAAGTRAQGSAVRASPARRRRRARRTTCARRATAAMKLGDLLDVTGAERQVQRHADGVRRPRELGDVSQRRSEAVHRREALDDDPRTRAGRRGGSSVGARRHRVDEPAVGATSRLPGVDRRPEGLHDEHVAGRTRASA